MVSFKVYYSVKYLELLYFLFPKIKKNCFLGNEVL